jgi:hypothetical protein
LVNEPIFNVDQFNIRAVPNLDLPAICSPKFKPGPPTEEAQVLSDRLNEALIACAFPFAFPIEFFNDLSIAPKLCRYLRSAYTQARQFGYSTLTQRA